MSGFGFNIPSNARIEGIRVEISCSSMAYQGIAEEGIKLVYPGGETATIDNDEFWPLPPYGGPDDTWGRSWTASEINSPDFKVVFRGICDDISTYGYEFAYVDGVKVKVYWRLPPLPWN